jgi:uncharacterized membrane protein
MSWIIYMVLAMIIQGSLVFAVKILSQSFAPLLMLFMQYLGGLIFSLMYVFAKKINIKAKKKELFLALLSGFLVSTGLAFYYEAVKLAPISIVSPLQSIGIMVIQVALGMVFLKEKPTKRVWAGLGCAVVCIIFLTI